MESNIPIRKTERMWKGRDSAPGSRYFVTICVKDREPTLLDSDVCNRLLEQLETQQFEKDIELNCATIMADHLHLLFRLGNRLAIGQVVAKFKAKTKQLVSWQRDFYEHQIRPDESEENYAFYVFMNPYVGSHCKLDKPWLWWRRWRNNPYQFEEMLGEKDPIPTSWINRAEELDIEI